MGFAVLYDQVMKLEALSKVRKARKNIITEAHGHVLEIGSGTGINFPFYKKASSVEAIEPNRNMIERSMKQKRRATVPIHINKQSAENISFPENTFDSVVSTLVFCTIPNPVKALNNIQRVAKPGATILFLEHVKMKQTLIARTQDLLTPTWQKVADGCHLNRDTLATIKMSDLEIKDVKTFYKGLVIVVKCINSKPIST